MGKDDRFSSELTPRSFGCLVIVVLCFFLMILAGIKYGNQPPAPPEPFQGTLTGKHWIPAHDEITYMYMHDHNTGITNMMPIVTPHSDEWRIHIGKRWKKVSKSEFEKAEIGVFYPSGPP